MKYNRLNEIELYLSQKQYASIEDLLEKFNISLQTLRRATSVSGSLLKKIVGMPAALAFSTTPLAAFASTMLTQRTSTPFSIITSS